MIQIEIVDMDLNHLQEQILTVLEMERKKGLNRQSLCILCGENGQPAARTTIFDNLQRLDKNYQYIECYRVPLVGRGRPMTFFRLTEKYWNEKTEQNK